MRSKFLDQLSNGATLFACGLLSRLDFVPSPCIVLGPFSWTSPTHSGPLLRQSMFHFRFHGSFRKLKPTVQGENTLCSTSESRFGSNSNSSSVAVVNLASCEWLPLRGSIRAFSSWKSETVSWNKLKDEFSSFGYLSARKLCHLSLSYTAEFAEEDVEVGGWDDSASPSDEQNLFQRVRILVVVSSLCS